VAFRPKALTLGLIALYSLLAVGFFTFPPILRAQYEAKGKAPEKIEIYTALTATTAQIPLFGALAQGWPGRGIPVEINYWKNLDDMRGLMLAGKGHIWVGHLEGMALAASRGAPVSLLAVTAWKKFFFLSGPIAISPDETIIPQNPMELSEALSAAGLPLMVTPQNSPAGGILERIARKGGPSFKISGLPPQQLALELAAGRQKAGLMPEPLATAALSKNPELRVVGSLEEEYAALFGGPPRLPQAGVAVNLSLARDNPELVAALLEAMVGSLEKLGGDKAKAIALLPPESREALGEGIIMNSLSRDLLLASPAFEAKEEIFSFLCLAAPQICPEAIPNLPESFIFRAPRSPQRDN
jgi:NitT/TauT family transport system substrate-binding protein